MAKCVQSFKSAFLIIHYILIAFLNTLWYIHLPNTQFSEFFFPLKFNQSNVWITDTCNFLCTNLQYLFQRKIGYTFSHSIRSWDQLQVFNMKYAMKSGGQHQTFWTLKQLQLTANYDKSYESTSRAVKLFMFHACPFWCFVSCISMWFVVCNIQ